ncbi:molybdopterin-guanine dinucleotide biosynthesis protein B [Candidatus Acidulodesulfobacterium sp. H_13]|uniref:molybdopterin-guanine dinucleotide biosynthesis protein B n=1 Tax=Candidatus Acidulodesulfobacterium sp. H_13 TaxID=3395470 RepID=UPI003AF8BAF3
MSKDIKDVNGIVEKAPNVVSFVAKSGTGKTTLIEKIIKILSKKGYRVSSIKHTDHDFDADIPGKDSWRHKNAGAYSTMILSGSKMAFFSDIDSSLKIIDMIPKYFRGSDIVIIEGFKDIDIRKIELFRKELNPDLKLRFGNDSNLLLICSDEFIDGIKTPQININNAQEIADYIECNIISRVDS